MSGGLEFCGVQTNPSTQSMRTGLDSKPVHGLWTEWENFCIGLDRLGSYLSY